MNKRYSLNDPTSVIEALVDGELEGEEYRRVILWLDAHPQYWRQCALAFLEEQALERDLRAIADYEFAEWAEAPGELVDATGCRDDSPGGVCPADNGLPAGTIGTQSSSNPSVVRNAMDTSPHDGPAGDKQIGWLAQLTTLAATLLLGVSLGWNMPRWQRQPTQIGADATHSVQPELASQTEGDSPSVHVPSENPQIPASARGEGTRESSHASLHMASETSTRQDRRAGVRALRGRLVPVDIQPPPVLQKLAEEGLIGLESDDALMLMELDDGTSAIVPVQQYRVTPGVYSY